MKKRRIGKSGIEVFPIGIGLWAIGGDKWGPTDDRESMNTIDAALDQGVDFFDTADVYGGGHSESLLGKAMEGRRDKFVVASKIGWVNYDGEKGQSAYTTPEKLIAGVESNLKRLNTDYIDIIQCHISYKDPTLDSFLEGFQRLQDAGKVRAFGVSSSDYGYIQEFNTRANMASLQIDYSILNRTPEQDILPYCKKQDIGVIIRGILAMGILTGKFDKNATFGEGDFRNNWITDPEQNAQFLKDLEVVEKLKHINPDKPLSHIALQFALANNAVSVIIPGAKTVKQLLSNMRAAESYPLSQEELKAIEQIVPSGGGRKIWPA